MVASKEKVKNCVKKIFICSDSQTALRAVSSPRTRPTLIEECGDALETLDRQREIEFVCSNSGLQRICIKEWFITKKEMLI